MSGGGQEASLAGESRREQAGSVPGTAGSLPGEGRKRGRAGAAGSGMRSVRGGRGRGTGLPGAGVCFPGVGDSLPGERAGIVRPPAAAARAAGAVPGAEHCGRRRPAGTPYPDSPGTGGEDSGLPEMPPPPSAGVRGVTHAGSCLNCSRCPRCVPAVFGALGWEQDPHPARDGEGMPRCGSSSCVQPWDVLLSPEFYSSAPPDSWGSVWILPLPFPHLPTKNPDNHLQLHPRCRRELLSQGSQKMNPACPAFALALGFWSAVASLRFYWQSRGKEPSVPAHLEQLVLVWVCISPSSSSLAEPSPASAPHSPSMLTPQPRCRHFLQRFQVTTGRKKFWQAT